MDHGSGLLSTKHGRFLGPCGRDTSSEYFAFMLICEETITFQLPKTYSSGSNRKGIFGAKGVSNENKQDQET